MRESPSVRARVLGAIKGLATGDAIGKQTEGLTRDQILVWYPGDVRGFEGQPGAPIPRYAQNPKRRWRIGETTDDTECTMAVARAALRALPLSHTTVGEELLKCRKSVHPGVRSYWEFHEAGTPDRIAVHHDGCGAAIRVAPVGVVYRPPELDRIVADAHEASIPTHGGSLAIAAAAATAAGLSAAIEGWAPRDVAAFAIQAAELAEHLWPPSDARRVSAVIASACEDLSNRGALRAEELVGWHAPSGSLGVVPLAIALATVTASAESSILLAANIGGDSDSVASIAGALAGALGPETVNDEWYEVVEAVNEHGLAALADDLLALR